MAGVATAEEIRSRFPEAGISFFGTGNAVERRCLRDRGFESFDLKGTGWKGTFVNSVMFVYGFTVSLFRCLRALRDLKPDAVIGLGGYASLAPVVSALVLRIPVVILEQNIIPGKANRLLSRFADLMLCHGPSPKTPTYCRDARRLHFTGTPLRRELFSYERDKAAEFFGLSPEKITVLVLGGSQGAAAVNRAVMGCLSELAERQRNIQVIHCTGRDDYLLVKRAYEIAGVEARVFDFLDEMGAAYGMADLAVSRAGATTLAELTAKGIPTVLIPYPYGADNHQHANAMELSRRGAAVVLDECLLTSERLLKVFSELLDGDRERLEEMRFASWSIGKPKAAEEVVDLTLKLLKEKNSGNICRNLSPQIT